MTMPSEVWLPSPNYTVDGITQNKFVFHTTEGARTIRDLGAWFAQPAAQCSSHWGADNLEAGTVGAYVWESNRAWTQANANPFCLSVELCAFASWSRDYWLNTQSVLLHNAADLCGAICRKYGIPIRALTAAEAQSANVKGCCQHRDFGAWGGGHVDCGPGFPMDIVLQWAAQTAPKPPTPIVQEIEEMELIAGAAATSIRVKAGSVVTVSAGADPAVLTGDGKAIVRVAALRQSGGWNVQSLYIDSGNLTPAVSVPADTVLLSMVRMDANPGGIIPLLAGP